MKERIQYGLILCALLIGISNLTLGFASGSYGGTIGSLFEYLQGYHSENGTNQLNQYRLNGTNIKDNTVTSYEIQDKTITDIDIKNNSVTGLQIKDGSITNVDIQNNTISGDKIQNNTITSAHIKDGSITNVNIQNNTISGDKIQNNTITREHLSPDIAANIAGGIKFGTSYQSRSFEKEYFTETGGFISMVDDAHGGAQCTYVGIVNGEEIIRAKAIDWIDASMFFYVPANSHYKVSKIYGGYEECQSKWMKFIENQ